MFLIYTYINICIIYIHTCMHTDKYMEMCQSSFKTLVQIVQPYCLLVERPIIQKLSSPHSCMSPLVFGIWQNPKEVGSNTREGMSTPDKTRANSRLNISCHKRVWPGFKMGLLTSSDSINQKFPHKGGVLILCILKTIRRIKAIMSGVYFSQQQTLSVLTS